MKNTILVLFALEIGLAIGTQEAGAQFVWTKDARNPILSGVVGTWNKHVFNPSVLYNADSARYEMWFNSSPGEQGLPYIHPWSVGFATSKDGIKWTIYPSVVLSPGAGSWDQHSIFPPEVIRENGQYKMWYVSYKDAATPNGLGYATSPDGIHWMKYPGNPIFGPGTAAWEAGGPECVQVMPVHGGYKMWYAGYDAAYAVRRIGYATSVDGITWKRDTVNSPILVPGALSQWDSRIVTHPTVLHLGNTYYMWYVGQNTSGTIDATGLATSPDGITHWEKYANNPVLAATPGAWDDQWADAGTVLLRGDTLDMWYDGWRSPETAYQVKIGHATSPITSVWSAQTSGTANDLYRISFTDGNTGTIAGASGTILRTTDGGVTWTKQTSNTTYDLYGVSFWDSMNGWASGDNGVILHTTNGGAAWNLQPSGKTGALWDIYCTDANTATTAGALGTILHTTNGGATWTPQSSGVTRKLEALFFSNSSAGTTVGDTGTILRTTNGGATWAMQSSGTTNDLVEVCFTDSTTGIAVGAAGTILKTTNAGVTWAKQISGTTRNIWDVSFEGTTHGTAVGQYGTILRTLDGGATWSNQSSGVTGTLLAVCLTDPFSGFAAGNAGTILRLRIVDPTALSVNTDRAAGVPHDFVLEQNYPNPFNPTTVVSYQLPVASEVRLVVYDLLGREVAVLENERKNPGVYEVKFDGSGLSSGVYFYRLTAGVHTESKRMMLMK